MNSQAPKHNCFADIPKEKRARVNNSRFVVQMECGTDCVLLENCEDETASGCDTYVAKSA